MPIVGDVLAGRYRIDAPIGVGGMASVYRAADLRLERDVAVKVLLPNLAADPALAQRFEREALALAATSHPSIVKVFDVEAGDPTTGREPFYVMELCGGGSLADRLRTRARLEPDEVVDVIGAVAAGLADLHARGFVHRDVKPHNILFDHERARLADFGLARSEETSELSSLTASGATVGTLAYIAPELLRGDAATPASDVYALGVVAFQGLTGRLPRPATAVAELVESHGEPAPTVSSIVPESERRSTRRPLRPLRLTRWRDRRRWSWPMDWWRHQAAPPEPRVPVRRRFPRWLWRPSTRTTPTQTPSPTSKPSGRQTRRVQPVPSAPARRSGCSPSASSGSPWSRSWP